MSARSVSARATKKGSENAKGTMPSLPEWWPGKRPYIIGECIEGMKHLPSESIDLIVTDPPFVFSIGSSVRHVQDG